MNDRGPRIQNSKVSAGGSPRVPGRRTGNGTRPVRFLVSPLMEWLAGFAMKRFNSGTGRHFSQVGKGGTCSTPVVRSRAVREVQHRHHSAAQQSTTEPCIQDWVQLK